MRVYRIQDKKTPRLGPFNDGGDYDMIDVLFGMTSDPARRAQRVADEQNVQGPYDMPNGEHDGISNSRISHLHHAGFASLDQFYRWFGSPEVREKLFEDGRMEMVCVQVPEEKVLIGNDQVMFRFTDKVGNYHHLQSDLLIKGPTVPKFFDKKWCHFSE